MDKNLIYAVDDEQAIRELYSYSLSGAGFEIQCFGTGADMLAASAKNLPDLVLLDIMLDGEDGYEILEKIRRNARFALIPVIMVSAKGEEISKVKGLNLGADDYISKPFGILELIARVNANLRKYSVDKKRDAHYVDLAVDDGKHEICLNGKALVLTLKEYNLLKLLIENAPKVVERSVILDSVWGADYFGETRTLDIHIAELRKKIGESAVEIATVRGVGYALKGRED